LHFIQQPIEEGTINLSYCPTDDMIADVLMKSVPRRKHVMFSWLMGMDDRKLNDLNEMKSESHGTAWTSPVETKEQHSSENN
jgi:hypothetical protein